MPYLSPEQQQLFNQNKQFNQIKQTKDENINKLIDIGCKIYSCNSKKIPTNRFGQQIGIQNDIEYEKNLPFIDYGSDNFLIKSGSHIEYIRRETGHEYIYHHICFLDFDLNQQGQKCNAVFNQIKSLFNYDLEKIHGLFNTSTPGNFGMLFDLQPKGYELTLPKICYLMNKYRSYKNKYEFDGLEFGLENCNQVIPPSTTESKTNEPSQKRRFFSNKPLYKISSEKMLVNIDGTPILDENGNDNLDPVYKIICDFLEEEMIKHENKQRIKYPDESNEIVSDVQKNKLEFYIECGIKSKTLNKFGNITSIFDQLNRNEWLMLASVCKQTFGPTDGETIFHELSIIDERYDENEASTFFRNANKEGIYGHVGQFYYWIKQNYPNVNERIKARYHAICQNELDRELRWPSEEASNYATELLFQNDPITTLEPLPELPLDQLDNNAYLADVICDDLKDILVYTVDKYKPADNGQWFMLNEKNLWVPYCHLLNEYVCNVSLKFIEQHIDVIKVEKEKVIELLKNTDKDSQKALYEIYDNQLKQLTFTCKQYTKRRNQLTQVKNINDVTNRLRGKLFKENFIDQLNIHPKKLAFQNGMLDIETMEFREGILPSDNLTDTLNINYEQYDKDNETHTTKRSFVQNAFIKIMNNNEHHLNYLLSVLGHAYLGISHTEKVLYFCIDEALTNHTESSNKKSKIMQSKKGNNGKSFIFEILKSVMSYYTGKKDSEFIEYDNTKLFKQVATLKHFRTVFIDELGDKKINIKFLKELACGEMIEKDKIYGEMVQIPILFKLIVCSNFLPPFHCSADDAIYNRYKQISFKSKFLEIQEDDIQKLHFKKDIRLKEKLINEYAITIIQLIIEYGHKYLVEEYANGQIVKKSYSMPYEIPDEFETSAETTMENNDDFGSWFRERTTRCGKTSIACLVELYNQTNIKKIDDAVMRKKIVHQTGYQYDKNLTFPEPFAHAKHRGGFQGFQIKPEYDHLLVNVKSFPLLPQPPSPHHHGKRTHENTPADQQPSKKQCQNERNQCATPGHEDLDNEYDY